MSGYVRWSVDDWSLARPVRCGAHRPAVRLDVTGLLGGREGAAAARENVIRAFSELALEDSFSAKIPRLNRAPAGSERALLVHIDIVSSSQVQRAFCYVHHVELDPLVCDTLAIRFHSKASRV